MTFSEEDEWRDWAFASQILTIAIQALGLFVWVKTVVDFILGWADTRGMAGRDRIIADINQLGGGLNDLDSLYSFVLDKSIGSTTLNEVEIRQQLEHAKVFLGFLDSRSIQHLLIEMLTSNPFVS